MFDNYSDYTPEQLNAMIDAEVLMSTVDDILQVHPDKRSAAIDQFIEIDPALGAKLRIAVRWRSRC